MAAQDGIQASGVSTVTTSAGVAVQFAVQAGTSALGMGFRARQLLFINDGSSSCYLDVTQGGTLIATTSMSYPIKSGETLNLSVAIPMAFYSGFSAVIAQGSGAGTLRFIATGW